MKKSENDCRSWRHRLASRSTNFQTFLSDQFFFYRNPPHHLRGGSAPHFAANAVMNAYNVDPKTYYYILRQVHLASQSFLTLN